MGQRMGHPTTRMRESIKAAVSVIRTILSQCAACGTSPLRSLPHVGSGHRADIRQASEVEEPNRHSMSALQVSAHAMCRGTVSM